MLNEQLLEAAIQLGQEAHSLSPNYACAAYDSECVRSNLRLAMTLPDWFLAIACIDTVPVGYIMGTVHSFIMSPAKHTCVEQMFVRAINRSRALVAKQLISALKFWAFNCHNSVMIRAGESSGISPRAVDYFFKRMGFYQMGTLYQMDKE